MDEDAELKLIVNNVVKKLTYEHEASCNIDMEEKRKHFETRKLHRLDGKKVEGSSSKTAS